MANVTVDVRRHVDGECVGSIELSAAEWEQYAVYEHPAYQWPEGLAEAGAVLTPDQVEEMGLTGRTVIWLE